MLDWTAVIASLEERMKLPKLYIAAACIYASTAPAAAAVVVTSEAAATSIDRASYEVTYPDGLDRVIVWTIVGATPDSETTTKSWSETLTLQGGTGAGSMTVVGSITIDAGSSLGYVDSLHVTSPDHYPVTSSFGRVAFRLNGAFLGDMIGDGGPGSSRNFDSSPFQNIPFMYGVPFTLQLDLTTTASIDATGVCPRGYWGSGWSCVAAGSANAVATAVIEGYMVPPGATYSVSGVPEPANLAYILSGLLALTRVRRRGARNPQPPEWFRRVGE
jgi:hypothetical protein